jgi:hypothetical protein
MTVALDKQKLLPVDNPDAEEWIRELMDSFR